MLLPDSGTSIVVPAASEISGEMLSKRTGAPTLGKPSIGIWCSSSDSCPSESRPAVERFPSRASDGRQTGVVSVEPDNPVSVVLCCNLRELRSTKAGDRESLADQFSPLSRTESFALRFPLAIKSIKTLCEDVRFNRRWARFVRWGRRSKKGGIRLFEVCCVESVELPTLLVKLCT